MKSFSGVLCSVYGFYKRGVFKEIAVAYGLCYLREVLIDYSARTHIEVADFAVAHLTVGQTDAHPARAQSGGGIIFNKIVYVLASVDRNGVAFAVGRQSIAVHNNYCIRNTFHRLLQIICQN